MSFDNGSSEDLTQVRVSGKVEPLEDLELKKEIVEKREFLKPVAEQYGYDPLAVFRLRNGVASVWKMKTNFEPTEYVEL